MFDYFGLGTKTTCMEHTNPRIAASLFTPSLNYFPTHMILQQSEETVDRVSLYLTLLAFSAPTGENAPLRTYSLGENQPEKIASK
ncbi:hypothetical protein T01_11870 [Trichinella spiralis]|uniref:Uncharacterized protein n=1 Tax=Trichinella spiralis TaxID=6334 RepID=A0A0V1BK05_TRISP|nr:hypothetical protein T01_11870 [Trichinella spiralis]